MPNSRWLMVFAALLASPATPAQSLGSAFTFQGELRDAGRPAEGLHDLQVCLYDDPVTALELQCAPDFDDVPIERGQFTLSLDFGSARFDGNARYLEVRVRAGGSTGGYTTLAPRQPIRPAPEALRAAHAATTPWSGLRDVPAGFADGSDGDSGGTVTSITAGPGLNGGTITGSGTLALADGGVGPAQIATNAVDGTRVLDGSISADDLADDAVGAGELADGAVDTAAVEDRAITSPKLATGAVGAAQIDATQVQARIGGTCPVGEYFRGVGADGSVTCEPVPGVPRITVVDDPANTVGEYGAVRIAPDGLPIISYQDNTLDTLKVAKCANAACTGAATITTLDDPVNSVGQHTSIAFGTDNLPVISYFDATARALKVATCANASCTAAATITTVDDPANVVGQYTSIAVGSDGLPVVSYYDGSAGALKVAKCANAACSGAATITTVDDSANDVGSYSQIAIGTDDRPVISYYDATIGKVRIAKCANAACTGAATITTVNDPASPVILFPTMALGTDGLPVIAYRANDTVALRVAKCADPSCTAPPTFTTVDDPDNTVAAFISIAVGNDGLPVIAHYDSAADALKVAKCTNAACTGAAIVAMVEDPATNVGAYASIAVGADMLPVISYWDATLRALKVAKCGTRSCQ